MGASHHNRRRVDTRRGKSKTSIDRGPSAGPSVRVVVRLKKSEILVFSNLYSSRTRRLYTRETHPGASVGRPHEHSADGGCLVDDDDVVGWLDAPRRETRARDVGSGDGRTTKRQGERTNVFPFGGTRSAWSASSVGTRSSDFNFIPIHSSVSFRSKRGAFWGWCLSICLVE